MDRREHRITILVPPEDMDALGHVNNAAYVRYIEAVATAHAERVGMGLEVLRSLEAVPVMREHRIKYLRPAVAGEVLEVRTLVTHTGGVRATRLNTITRDGAVLVESETLWAWLHPVTGRPRAVPETVMAAFGFPSGPFLSGDEPAGPDA